MGAVKKVMGFSIDQNYKSLLVGENTNQRQKKNNINDWRGNLEQIDDILLIGVRIA